MDRRNFIKAIGAGAASGFGLRVFADLRTIGDPNQSYAAHMRWIDRLPADVPSATLKDGKILQPAREIPVFHEADVVVVGGGPAGVAAAVSAARQGAKTALVERYGSLGGLFTNGLVLIFIGTGDMVDGKFRLCTDGFCGEFIRRLEAMGPGAITGRPPVNRKWHPTADPEAAKVLMDRMTEEAGVEVFFHSWGVDVIQVGPEVKGVVFESKQGRQAILAKQIVDCSGDGDVYFQAGAAFLQLTHSIGFCYQIGGMDRIRESQIPAALRRRFPTRSNEPNPHLFWKNAESVGGNGLSVRELSSAERHHRREAWKFVSEMRATPGCEEAYLSSTASQLGVRATRLMDGEKTISKDDPAVRSGVAIPDSVAFSGNDGSGCGFAIPWGCLLPKEVENVIAAGRCISCSPDLIDRVRLFPVCFVTGQAAGTAAALAAKKGCHPRDLEVSEIRRALLSAGAYLG